MASDPEKRLQKVIDKLYHSPSGGPEALGGRRKGPAPAPVLGRPRGGLERRLRVPPGPTVGPTPTCRPWDRGDMMRRLATFKAMTWFCKPKVVSPVNCARRGWINIEMDILVCEACGARLLFSTPSSWTLQQVENAAAVFSLKLDNGHKLLCPWINNACDEALALFPPLHPPALVGGYRERSSALLQLSALPLISSLAIDYMKSPQLEHFLSQSPHMSITLSNGVRLTDGCGSKDLEGVSEASAANLYDQALKIISLCGWEPRVLSYVVENENHPSLPANDAHPSGSPVQILVGQKHGFTVYPSGSSDEVEKGPDDHPNLHEHDPASVVLDCRLCGACVGLWAFATIPRPLEIFSLVSSSNSIGQCEPDTSHADLTRRIEAPSTENLDSEKDSDKTIAKADINSKTTKDRSLGLNLTIAGGPPPTKQNFKPRVSFPVISRHLRAQLGSSSTIKKSLQQEDISGGSPEGVGLLKRKRSEYVSEEGINNMICDNGNGEKPGDSFSIDRNHSTQELSSVPVAEGDAVSLGQLTQNKNEEPPFTVREDGHGVKVGENQCTTSEDHISTMDAGGCKNNSVTGSADVCYHVDDVASITNSLNQSGNSENNHRDSSNIASCPSTNATLSSIHNQDLEKCMTNDLKDMVPYFDNKELAIQRASGNNIRAALYDKIDEFDPIRQHRTFCPWIAPMDGENTSGWKLTLSALCHEEKDSSQSLSSEVQSSLLDEADDPLVSVRRLFMSPSAKKAKISQ